jgi:hypothetical protein
MEPPADGDGAREQFQALLFEDTPHATPVPQLVGMRGECIGGLMSFGRPASRATSGRARPLVGAGLRAAASDRAAVSSLCSLKAAAESYALPMTCRVEVFVRSGHTIDLALEDGEDRVFADGLHEAWASPDSMGYKHLPLGENAAILASEVVGYRLHGSILQESAM